MVERGTPTAVCSHGPLIPDLLARLHALVDPAEPTGPAAAALLLEAADAKMAKGEALVAHLAGTGAQARVVAVERLLP